jgi:hypothetical protein
MVWLDGELLIAGESAATGISVQGIMRHKPDYTDLSKGKSALITSEFSTGYMHGGILANLICSTDSTTIKVTKPLIPQLMRLDCP